MLQDPAIRNIPRNMCVNPHKVVRQLVSSNVSVMTCITDIHPTFNIFQLNQTYQVCQSPLGFTVLNIPVLSTYPGPMVD